MERGTAFPAKTTRLRSPQQSLNPLFRDQFWPLDSSSPFPPKRVFFGSPWLSPFFRHSQWNWSCLRPLSYHKPAIQKFNPHFCWLSSIPSRIPWNPVCARNSQSRPGLPGFLADICWSHPLAAACCVWGTGASQANWSTIDISGVKPPRRTEFDGAIMGIFIGYTRDIMGNMGNMTLMGIWETMGFDQWGI